MGHHHHETKNLGITILLNLIITIAQVIGGIIAGSMALLSDATHNFSDVFALIISYVAKKMAKRDRTETKTYGYKRAEIFAAFINSVTLIAIASVLFYEAVKHLFHPEPVNGTIVIYLAALSIILNGVSVLLIKKEAGESMSIRSAYLHLFTDMLTSIVVLLGGLAVKYYALYWMDPALSLIIAIYLIVSSWKIFKESIGIFMQFTPSQIDVGKIAEKISGIPGVKNVHHLHVWQLDDHEYMLECHIDLTKDIAVSEFELILKKIKSILETFHIHHSNIQPEFLTQDNKAIIVN